MPIEVSCASCSGHFRVPDTAAGKKIRCPKCRGAIEVPAAEATPARPTEVIPPPPAAPTAPAAPALPAPKQSGFVPPPAPKKQPTFVPPPPAEPAEPPAPPQPKADEWHFKTATGEEYGPVGRDELDEWLREGRITADCQILHAADDEWRWASEIYPQLKPPEARGSGVVGRESESSAGAAIPLPPAAEPQSPAVNAPLTSPKLPSKAKKPAPAESDNVDCSQRSRLVAGFLGVFLGPLGIHRFYLGYWGVGLAMMITAGGLGLWSLIDAIFVMTGRVPDADGRPLSP